MSSDSSLNAIIGERIRLTRKKRNVTREALAERIDVSSRYLASLEWGQVGASVATLKKICVELGVSSDYLLDISDESDFFDEIKASLGSLQGESRQDAADMIKVFCRALKRNE